MSANSQSTTQRARTREGKARRSSFIPPPTLPSAPTLSPSPYDFGCRGSLYAMEVPYGSLYRLKIDFNVRSEPMSDKKGAYLLTHCSDDFLVLVLVHATVPFPIFPLCHSTSASLHQTARRAAIELPEYLEPEQDNLQIVMITSHIVIVDITAPQRRSPSAGLKERRRELSKAAWSHTIKTSARTKVSAAFFFIAARSVSYTSSKNAIGLLVSSLSPKISSFEECIAEPPFRVLMLTTLT
ncbi:hypothetical protein BKA70DRAFT_1450661 [Coprinopsis sp. MPI-PUGE-AT-0042]|nr:hypothetical protein BKA70DRAFT_1450661 [Coprinopsis sp. MPI-PUGE-AT-0042]